MVEGLDHFPGGQLACLPQGTVTSLGYAQELHQRVVFSLYAWIDSILFNRPVNCA